MMSAIVRGAAAAILLVATTVGARADTLEDWRKIADRVVAIYEQSNDSSVEYDAASPDFDCQGLSLGSKQWPFRNGSIRKIFRRLGDRLEPTVTAAMPTHAETFLRAAAHSLGGRHAQARQTTLELQRTQASGCDGPKGVGFKPGVETELKAWLTMPEVLAAQVAEEQAVSSRAIALAACWTTRIDSRPSPAFHEYLFFYDFLTQNGGAWVEDGILIDAYAKVNYGQYGKTDADLVNEKLDLIQQFYETDWRVAFAKGYLRDADKNAAVLKAAHAAGNVGKSEVGLLLVKMFRGILGNTPFALTSMNRGVISLFGQGSVNGGTYDIRDDIAAAGGLDEGEVPADLDCAAR